ncbi:hypothetical protein Syun_012509 [Stephania yunnanensis]|uniref:Uncharacterized protein n=1 Tax=Stephania yunnanensis TaxID=152371 RepID=A0AAP0PHK2_9MAGN
MWQNAAAQLAFMRLPPNLDCKLHDVNNSWTSVLHLDTDTMRFGHIATKVAKYCQFWKDFRTLSYCSPNGSAAGAVTCIADYRLTIFATPKWTTHDGNHNNYQHENANRVGHYSMRQNTMLTFKSSTTVEDIPHTSTLLKLAIST